MVMTFQISQTAGNFLTSVQTIRFYVVA